MKKINPKDYRHIFWDFDGVIKESANIKTLTFYDLFLPFGKNIALKVKEHHLKNAGISRFEKIPLYLKWAKVDYSKEIEKQFIDNFKNKVVEKVIKSKWVKGSKNFLKINPFSQSFYLVTATPQNEIEYILSRIGLNEVFKDCFGSPISKENGIKDIINSRKLKKKDCFMIGDALADMKAARKNSIDFVLREHKHNSYIFANEQIKFKIKNLLDIYE